MELVKLETPELNLIEESKAAKIKATFEPMVKMLEGFEDSYNEIIKESKKEITQELTQKAKRIRLDVGKVRIETGKLKDQQKEYIKLEDKAIMGVHNLLVWAVKEKEDKLKEIENHFEIQEQKRLEKLQNDRAEKLSKYVENAFELNLSTMDEEVFTAYYNSKKQEHEDRIAAEKKAEEERIEKERKEKLYFTRRSEVAKYEDFCDNIINFGMAEFGEMTDDEYKELMSKLEAKKANHDKEQEKIRLEKERLEKEAEKKRKEEEALMLRNKKRNEELKPYIIFIRDYDKMLQLNDKEYQKELAEIKIGAEQHWEYERQEQIKKANQEEKDRQEREKLKAKLEAKQEAEQKEKQRLLDEEQKRLKAEKKARLAPDKDKLLQFAESLDSMVLPELKSNEAGDILKNIVILIGKTTSYIREKAETL
jgi:hypothetical protein